jgi:undecaprenyl-diphosphatase
MAPFAALACLAWRTPWRCPILLVGSPVVLLVGVSRVALDEHYPTDIFAGWATSLVWVTGVWTIRGLAIA